jgi:hypothetical protein
MRPEAVFVTDGLIPVLAAVVIAETPETGEKERSSREV